MSTGVIASNPAPLPTVYEPKFCCCKALTGLLVVAILDALITIYFIVTLALNYQYLNGVSNGIGIALVVGNGLAVISLFIAFCTKRSGFAVPYIVWKIIQMILQVIGSIGAIMILLGGDFSVYEDPNAVKRAITIALVITICLIIFEITAVVGVSRARIYLRNLALPPLTFVQQQQMPAHCTTTTMAFHNSTTMQMGSPYGVQYPPPPPMGEQHYGSPYDNRGPPPAYGADAKSHAM